MKDANPEAEVRKAQPGDAPMIDELMRRALPDICLPATLDRLRRDALHRDDQLVVAARDGSVVGVILVQPPEAMLVQAERMAFPPRVIDYIYDRYRKIVALAVAEDARGVGLGRQLICAVAREVWPAPGWDRYLYGQFDWDPRLRRFYRSGGFWVLGPNQPLQFGIRDLDGTPYAMILPPTEPDERWFVGIMDGDDSPTEPDAERPVSDPRARLGEGDR